MSNNKGFSIEAMELGPMENFIYIIHDHVSNRAAVVDPAWNVAYILERAEEKGVKITDILLSHSHADHINGVQEVLDVYDAEVHMLKAEATFSGKFQEIATLHYGGDVIKLGETQIEILHTPGHTPGSACFHIGGELITGDTLFVFGCGRCDLAGGDPNQMFDTLNKIKQSMPQDTLIHPGHNYAEIETSTLAEQIEGNPFLHFNSKADFVRYRMVEHDKIRDIPYHPVMQQTMKV